MAKHHRDGPGGPEQDLDEAQDLLQNFNPPGREGKGKSFKPYLLVAMKIAARVRDKGPSDLHDRAESLLEAIKTRYKEFFGEEPYF